MKSAQLNRSTQRPNVVDRLAAVYQQARLHKRRMHRCLSLALTAGDIPAVRAALARFRTAAGWEARTRRRYERAVLLEYAWWTHGTNGTLGPAAQPARAARNAGLPGAA